MSATHELTCLLESAEAGDDQSCLALATIWWQGSPGIEKNDLLANIYLNRYFLLRAKRLPIVGCERPPEGAIQQYLQTHADQDDREGDCVIPHVFCPSCCLTQEDPSYCIFTGVSSCGTAEDALGYGLRCVENVCKGCSFSCGICGGPLKFVAADFITPTFHTLDYLMVRVIFAEENLEATTYGVLWWKARLGEVECIVDEIPDESEKCLMALERAAKLLACHFDDLAAVCVESAAKHHAGDPSLLHGATLLSGKPYTELAERIVRAHIVQFPEDPLGHLQLAEVLTQGRLLANGKVSNSILEEALTSVREALLFNPLLREAILLECMLFSLSNTPLNETIKAYKALLKRFPSYGPGHYDLALYCRQLTPDISKRHFMLAKRLLPAIGDLSLENLSESVSTIASNATT